MYWDGNSWHMELNENKKIHSATTTRARTISEFLGMAKQTGLPEDIDAYDVTLEKVMVKPRIGGDCMAGKRLIVEVCPYCGKQHIHTTRFGADETMDRMADCGGEYTLDCN